MLDDFYQSVARRGVAFVAGPIGCFVIWRRLAYFAIHYLIQPSLSRVCIIARNKHHPYGLLTFRNCIIIIVLAT